MTTKEQRFLNSWEKAIKLGRLKYSLINTLFFGIFTFVISSLINYYAFDDHTIFETSRIVIGLTTFFIVGFLMFYFFTWKQNSKRYNDLIKKE